VEPVPPLYVDATVTITPCLPPAGEGKRIVNGELTDPAVDFDGTAMLLGDGVIGN
jgi:hypothetical protein